MICGILHVCTSWGDLGYHGDHATDTEISWDIMINVYIFMYIYIYLHNK